MTDPRTHPVQDAEAHAAAVGEYKRAGYRVETSTEGRTVMRTSSRGSLLAHLALFFTVGWLTFGLLNLWYARRKRKATEDRVAVVTR